MIAIRESKCTPRLAHGDAAFNLADVLVHVSVVMAQGSKCIGAASASILEA